ncbi:MAG: hypothetical protein ABFC57_17285 [Veillonellales bacterium]
MAKFKSSAPDQGQLVPMYLADWIPENHLVYLVNDIVGQLDLSAMSVILEDDIILCSKIH